MAFAFPREAVRAIVSKALGNWPKTSIIFRDEAEPMVAPKAGQIRGLVRLDVARRAAVGNDCILRIEKNDGSNREIYGGQRKISFMVRAESHDPNVPAFDILEGMRLRLNFDSSLQLWRDVGLALADWGQVVPITNPVQNRLVSTAVLELTLNQVVELEDANPAGVIEKVSSTTPVDPGAAPVADLTGTYTP